MEKNNRSATSKFLSLILRHRPELIGLQLDENGWVSVQELIEKIGESGRQMDLEDLERLVENNDKKRFSFSKDRSRIRANQGHSVSVDLDLTPKAPPEVLYHGTGESSVTKILRTGLQKMNRHHVHLSTNIPTAKAVGNRHGKPVVFEIATGIMYRDGYKFYRSDNGVWLVEEVPVVYMKRL